MPSGFALTSASSVEVLAAYSAPRTTVLAVESTPGWQVVGAFYLPKTTTARVDALIMVSDPSLTCRVRLYDSTVGAIASRVVPGYASTSSIDLARKLGPVVTLTGGHLYQLQCEVTGDEGDGLFGVVHTATITN